MKFTETKLKGAFIIDPGEPWLRDWLRAGPQAVPPPLPGRAAAASVGA